MLQFELFNGLEWHGWLGQGSDSVTSVFAPGFFGGLDFLLADGVQTAGYLWVDRPGVDFYVCDSVAGCRFGSVAAFNGGAFFLSRRVGQEIGGSVVCCDSGAVGLSILSHR